MLLLIISLVLAFLPWLGIAWIVLRGSITTVDGLFMGLILLTMSGIFALSAAIEFPRARRARAIRAELDLGSAGTLARLLRVVLERRVEQGNGASSLNRVIQN